AYVRLALPRRHVPVEVADVIPRLVRPQFREHQPDPWPGAVIRPRQQRHGLGPHAEPQPPGAPHDRRRVGRGSGLRGWLWLPRDPRTSAPARGSRRAVGTEGGAAGAGAGSSAQRTRPPPRRAASAVTRQWGITAEL